MFPGGKFGTPYFIQYGKAGTQTAHNSDKYVYAISNNGFWDNGDNMKLGRVLKSKIGGLDASDWEYYKGGDGMNDAAWTKYINETVTDKAGYLIHNPTKCSMTGASYISELGRYIMVQWYHTMGSCLMDDEAELKKRGLANPGEETVLDFYESPYPWGPWTLFHSYTSNPIGMYNPCVITKLTSNNGKKLVIFTNGSSYTSSVQGDGNYYKLITVECELETE
jgi:hypothetical protein